jgi:D-beta-D-heptose 7-phosphate kinase/D-beta-D-heptose 1-phosphate adenosyltransferase
MSYDLIQTVQNLGQPRLLVLGDLILDRYTWGDAERVSQEAPVILLRADRREVRLGGAGNVGNMLAALGARPLLAGVVGKDVDGMVLFDELDRCGIDRSAVVVDPSRPTTVKERFIGRAQHRHPHQMLRVDSEVRDPLSPPVEQELLARI